MTRFPPPLRKEYLSRQKDHFGRKLFGVFPALYPRELLWAMDILPVEIWDPPLEVTHANAHLQSYICSVVRQGLELILQGKCEQLDGFLFPHTCDSLQNLASMVNNYLKQDKPCYFLYNPKEPHLPISRKYYLEEIKELADKIGARYGPIDENKLKKSIAQGQKINTRIIELYHNRRTGRLCSSNEEFYQVLRQSEFLHPDDLIPLLDEFLNQSTDGIMNGTPLILSGILPGPPGFLSLLDELGLTLCDDDLINCGRRLPAGKCSSDDPFEYLVERFFSLPPCTTRSSKISDRLKNILGKAEDCGAKGIIFSMIRFCEPELFDLPQILQGLKENGLPTLVVDWEVNQKLSGQMRTRVEAFAEMLA